RHPTTPVRPPRRRQTPAHQQPVGERKLPKTRLQDLYRDSQQTQQLIKAHQARVEAAPMVEQQLAAIERDYALERQQYSDLSAKQRAAIIAASVERDRSGERFAVLEPATFPTHPIKPLPM